MILPHLELLELELEKAELEIKIYKLHQMFSINNNIDEKNLKILDLQIGAMIEYSGILETRIQILREKFDKPTC